MKNAYAVVLDRLVSATNDGDHLMSSSTAIPEGAAGDGDGVRFADRLHLVPSFLLFSKCSSLSTIGEAPYLRYVEILSSSVVDDDCLPCQCSRRLTLTYVRTQYVLRTDVCVPYRLN